MRAEQVLLLAASVALGALLLSLNLRSLWSWPVKALATVLSLGALFGAHLAVSDLVGKPSHAPLPERFELLAAQIQEPRPGGNEPGAIYLWVRDLAGTDASPRAFTVDYSSKWRRLVEEAIGKVEQGQPQRGRYAASGAAGGRGDALLEFETHRERRLPPKLGEVPDA